MKTNKLFRIMMMLLLVVGVSFAFISCSDDDEGGSIPSGLVGTWHGAGSRVHFYATFNSDHTYYCRGEKSWGTYYEARGTYSVSGSTIKCKNRFVFYDDGQNGESVTEYQYHGTYLTGGQNSSVQKYEKN